jgi:hypothetical protein
VKTIVAVAVTALVCSTGATAITSALITSSQIKDGTIQLRDLSPAARVALRGQRGPEGPEGPAGERGPQGLPGATGPMGPTGLAGRDGQSVDTFKIKRDLTELCNAGRELQQKVGGFYVYGLYSCLYFYP